MCCCKQTNRNGNESGNQDDNFVEQTIKIVNKEMPFVGQFYQITNTCCANIVFIPGPSQIIYSGPQHFFSLMKIQNDNGVLYIRMDDEKLVNKTDNGITLHISSPSLRTIAVCGSGDFTAQGNIKTEDMNVGNLGSGGIHLDSVSCKCLHYELHANAVADIKYIDCEEELSIVSVYGGHFYAEGKTTSLLIDAEGGGSVSFCGTYQDKEIYHDKHTIVTIN